MRSLLILLALAMPAFAGEAVVTDARATRQGAAWRFDVSVRHGDEGWAHYADAWRIEGPDGAVLGLREVLHPHEDEQPFTRSLDGVAIPAGLAQVTVRARDKVHGWGPGFALSLP